MTEFLVIVSAAVMIVAVWSTYIWGRATVKRLNKGKPSQILRAMLVMCVFVTALPCITFGGGNYWLATMLSIPFAIGMAIWLGYIASLVIKRRTPAMTQDVQGIDPASVKIRTVPQPVAVEPYNASGRARQRSARAMRVMREVEA